uniref:Sushi domain-containing protein n=1 Tax=Anas zonorhyncha TaxID=75864 RepID=A0A8B9ULQ6_9AVES
MVTAVTTIARLCTLVSISELTAWVPISVSIVHLKPCDYPVIENGKISERMAHSYFPMRIGQYVDYHCRNGYLAPNGGRVVRIYCSKGGWNPEPKCLSKCTSTISISVRLRKKGCPNLWLGAEQVQRGSHTPPWMPKCLFSDVTCEPPPEIAGGKVQGVKKPRYLPGETAHYQCWQGFQMTGASTVTCQNGTWTERPQCKGNCRLSETAMARNNIKLRWSSKRSNIYRSKETISFKCYFLFREVSNPEDFEAQCQDGVINYPRCESQLEK